VCMISLLRYEPKTSWTTGNLLLCPRTVNFPLFIILHASFAVHYIIRRALHYWTSRQPRPLHSRDGTQPQPTNSGFVTNQLPRERPVVVVLPDMGIIDRLRLFTGNSSRRLKCKLGQDEHTYMIGECESQNTSIHISLSLQLSRTDGLVLWSRCWPLPQPEGTASRLPCLTETWVKVQVAVMKLPLGMTILQWWGQAYVHFMLQL
jgi:hypothetical protein